MNTCIETAQKLSVLGENRVAFEGIKLTLYRKYIEKAEKSLPDPISKTLITYLSTKL